MVVSLSGPSFRGVSAGGPPDDWDGSWASTERTEPHLVLDAMVRTAEIMGRLPDTDEDDDPAGIGVDPRNRPPRCRCLAWSVSTGAPATGPCAPGTCAWMPPPPRGAGDEDETDRAG